MSFELASWAVFMNKLSFSPTDYAIENRPLRKRTMFTLATPLVALHAISLRFPSSSEDRFTQVTVHPFASLDLLLVSDGGHPDSSQ
jgi:hypothetical protein